jgi:hypothetical protein
MLQYYVVLYKGLGTLLKAIIRGIQHYPGWFNIKPNDHFLN